MTEWENVNDQTCYKIIVFDDGNNRYQKYENKWFKAEYDGYGEYTIQKTKQSIFSAKAICIRCYKALKKKID